MSPDPGQSLHLLTEPVVSLPDLSPPQGPENQPLDGGFLGADLPTAGQSQAPQVLLLAWNPCFGNLFYEPTIITLFTGWSPTWKQESPDSLKL